MGVNGLREKRVTQPLIKIMSLEYLLQCPLQNKLPFPLITQSIYVTVVNISSILIYLR